MDPANNLTFSNRSPALSFVFPPFSITHFKMLGYSRCNGVFMSRDPCSGPFQVLALAVTPYPMVAHLNSGEHFWTFTKMKSRDGLEKFVFYKDRILGLFCNGRIVSLNVIDVGGAVSRLMKLRRRWWILMKKLVRKLFLWKPKVVIFLTVHGLGISSNGYVVYKLFIDS